jgi:hypothetical protein
LIRCVSPGGNGAFSDNTQKVYLAVEFINKYASNTSKITDVLIEEIGHFVDSQINEIDATGDEGDIFSELVLGNKLSDEELKALREENDKVTILRGNNEEIGIEENTDNIRVGTWNMFRDQDFDEITDPDHVGRINKIADIGSSNNIDIIFLQEFSSARLLDLIPSSKNRHNQELAKTDAVTTALNNLALGYSFKFVIPEIPFDPYDNDTYKKTAYSKLGYADFSGYLVLYKNTITNISSKPTDYSSGPEFYQSSQWTESNVLGSGGSTTKLFRPPINFTATKGSTNYTFFTWHNEAPGKDLNPFIKFDNLLKSSPIPNSIILGDFNIGNTSSAWDIQNNQRNRFKDYNGWQNYHDLIITNASKVVTPIQLINNVSYATLKSDHHFPIFAEINFNPVMSSNATYTFTTQVKTNKRDSQGNFIYETKNIKITNMGLRDLLC